MTQSIRVKWGQENYEWAMSLRGKMSRNAAERITGIPADTLGKWWNGTKPFHLRDRPVGRPATHCRRGHALTPDNLVSCGTSQRENHRQCKKCKDASDRRYGYRKRRQFHAVWNPDPLLAPLEKLWLPGPAVLDFIRSRYSDEEVSVQFPDKNGVGAKRWYELRNGREWIRFDTAEKFLGVLGIVSSELGVDAVYSTVMPTRRDGGQQPAA